MFLEITAETGKHPGNSLEERTVRQFLAYCSNNKHKNHLIVKYGFLSFGSAPQTPRAEQTGYGLQNEPK